MAKGDTKTNQYLDIAANGTRADLPSDICCETRSQTLIREVAERIMDVEDEVEELKNNPDVVDIVATYADLQAYDTASLTDKDIIRVLQDETHDGDSTYYRYNKQTDTWTYIGESKQYTDFVGTDGTTAGEAGLVPAPATTDAGKFLKADGTWDDAGGVNIVQTTGTSTTDVMSQNAASSMVFADPATQNKIKIGAGASSSVGDNAIEIGQNSTASAEHAIAIGLNSEANNTGATAIGIGAYANGVGQIALGATSGDNDTTQGVMHIGPSNTYYGYNYSNYRLLTGLYDGQSAHDAATYGQVISYSAINGAGAPTTATEGKYVGQLYYDTTNEAMYFLKTIDTTTTPATYTWEALGGGSSVNVVQTTGTSTTDVMSQNAVTSMVYDDPGTNSKIKIGSSSNSPGTNAIQIGKNAMAKAESVTIGEEAKTYGANQIAIGRGATITNPSARGCIVLGDQTQLTGAEHGVMSIGNVVSTSYGYNNSNYRLLTGLYDGQSAHDAATVGQLDMYQRKPVTVWEVDGTTVTTGLVAVGEDMSATPNWQLTDLDMTPFTRIKIYSKAAQKAGTTASASTTPAIILEMSLDPRAAIAEYDGNYVSSNVVQKPNDPNRLCTLCCAVSADKTKFEVLRMTNLYGTAATSNSDVNAYVFKIEGYYD